MDGCGQEIADPGPVLQAGLLRVFLDVSREFQKVRRTTDEVVEIFALPERPGSAQQVIGAMRGIRLPGVKNVFEAVRPERRKQGVHMVGHHAPCEKIVTLSVKLPERVSDNFRDARITHVAFAKGIVKETLSFLDQPAKPAGALLVRGNRRVRLRGALDSFALRTKEIYEFARKRVRKAEGDEVNGAFAFPVGKIAARAS